jgi:hypothetical protein
MKITTRQKMIENKTKAYLERLKMQKEKLEARIQKAEAMKKVKDRKEDTRRKILVGSYYLDMAQKEGKWEQLVSRMDKYLTRNSDRKLFGLSESTVNELVEEAL